LPQPCSTSGIVEAAAVEAPGRLVVYDLTDIAEAHRYLEANGQFGKVEVTAGG